MYNLIEEFKRVALVLEDNNLAYALCGGLAVGVYSEPRGTIDIDMVVLQGDLEKIIEVLAPLGFEKWANSMPLGKGDMPIQRLIKFGKGEPEVLMLDLCMPAKERYPKVWSDWTRTTVEDAEIWVLSIEGLIEMKKPRSSTKDLMDIEALEKKLP